MTADDMVTVPRELAEKALFVMRADDRGDPSVRELAAILNPPPEFDPEMVEAIARIRHDSWSIHPWDEADADRQADWLAVVEKLLLAARDAGWEMVETTELTALRAMSIAWRQGGGFAVGPGEADAIRKAKEAGW